MKRWLYWALPLLLLLLGGCPQNRDSESQERILTVGMDPHIGRPFIYPIESGIAGQNAPKRYGGFEVEIVEYLARKLNKKLEIREVSWEKLLQEVSRQKIDLALNAIEKPQLNTPQLPPHLAFTEHYYTAFQQLVVRKKDTFTYNISDLRGKKVGVLRDSVSQVLLDDLNRLKNAGLQVVPYDDPEPLFADLALSRLSGILSERALAGWYIWKEPGLRLTGEAITPETPYVGVVHSQNQELLQQINQILQNGRKDPAFMQIFSKWHVSIRR